MRESNHEQNSTSSSHSAIVEAIYRDEISFAAVIRMLERTVCFIMYAFWPYLRIIASQSEVFGQ